MKTINAIGNPNPLALVRTAAERGEAEIEVLLDDPVDASVVVRFLESSRFTVQLLDDEGTMILTARKRTLAPDKTAEASSPIRNQPAVTPKPNADSVPLVHHSGPASGTLSVLITRSVLGSVSELGEELMRNFLAALSRRTEPLLSVALLNEGVKLVRYDGSACDHLKRLEKKGVSILVCGTCVNYFSMMDEVGAGAISGMDEILETVCRADKVITI